MTSLLHISKAELENLLQENSDMDNIQILLIMTELNLLDKIDRDKVSLSEKEDHEKQPSTYEEEDDLLSSPVTVISEEAKAKQKREIQMRIDQQETLLSKVREVLQSIMERPSEFIGNDTADKINKKLNRAIMPRKAETRSAIAKDILNKLIAQKEKASENMTDKSVSVG